MIQRFDCTAIYTGPLQMELQELARWNYLDGLDKAMMNHDDDFRPAKDNFDYVPIFSHHLIGESSSMTICYPKGRTLNNGHGMGHSVQVLCTSRTGAARATASRGPGWSPSNGRAQRVLDGCGKRVHASQLWQVIRRGHLAEQLTRFILPVYWITVHICTYNSTFFRHAWYVAIRPWY